MRSMQEAKNTARAIVKIGYTGTVYKKFLGPKAKERFENEIRVLKYLERNNCPFVPKHINSNPETLELETTNCGKIVERMSEAKQKEIFASLEQYGVRHDDAALRNITYNAKMGRFCVIDFEFATILEPGYPDPPTMEFDRNLDNLA